MTRIYQAFHSWLEERTLRFPVVFTRQSDRFLEFDFPTIPWRLLHGTLAPTGRIEVLFDWEGKVWDWMIDPDLTVSPSYDHSVANLGRWVDDELARATALCLLCIGRGISAHLLPNEADKLLDASSGVIFPIRSWKR